MNDDVRNVYRAMVLRLLARILYRVGGEAAPDRVLWKEAEALAKLLEGLPRK